MSAERDGVLHRWSRRKHAAKRAEGRPAVAVPVVPAAAPAAAAPAAEAIASPSASSPPGIAPVADALPAPTPEPLPPIESLTPQSDFTPFMRPGVDDSLKRAALKKLFADPHFNVMDGLDVYIDDYSKPDPIPPDMLARLLQNRALFDPPRTRVNADGVVEEIPSDAEPAAPAAAAEAVDAEAGSALAANESAIAPRPDGMPPAEPSR